MAVVEKKKKSLRDKVEGAISQKGGKKESKKEPAAVETEAAEVGEPAVAVEQPAAARPDFRGLPEPERTLARVMYILKKDDLKPAFRLMGALIVEKFKGIDSNVIELKMNKEFKEDDGFTTRSRSGTLNALEEAGLIRREQLHRVGMRIELLF